MAKNKTTTATKKFTITVEVEVDGDVVEMRNALADYLASKGCTFFDDYGYDAWGGYDGPFVVACAVKDDKGRTLSKYAMRNKPNKFGEYFDPDMNSDTDEQN